MRFLRISVIGSENVFSVYLMHLICASAPAECIEANGDSAVLFLADGRIQRDQRERERKKGALQCDPRPSYAPRAALINKLIYIVRHCIVLGHVASDVCR